MAFYYCGLPIVKSHKIERLLATWNANTRYSFKKKMSKLHFRMPMLNDHISWKIFDTFLIGFKTIWSTFNEMLCDRITCFHKLDFFLNISTNDTSRTISSTVLFTLNVSMHLFNYQIKMRNKRIRLRVMDNVASDCSFEKRKKHYDLHLTTKFSRILIIKVTDLCSEAVIHTMSIQWQILGYFFPLRDWHSSLKQTKMIGFIFVFF